MPETELTPEQVNAVRDWVYDTKSGEFVHNMYPGTENGLWNVDGEPFVIYGRPNESTGETDFTESGSVSLVFCNDRHARELEEAGVVQFPKPFDKLVKEEVLDKAFPDPLGR